MQPACKLVLGEGATDSCILTLSLMISTHSSGLPHTPGGPSSTVPQRTCCFLVCCTKGLDELVASIALARVLFQSVHARTVDSARVVHALVNVAELARLRQDAACQARNLESRPNRLIVACDTSPSTPQLACGTTPCPVSCHLRHNSP